MCIIDIGTNSGAQLDLGNKQRATMTRPVIFSQAIEVLYWLVVAHTKKAINELLF